MFNRKQLFVGMDRETAFFWGPRQTGKSTLLKDFFKDSPRYDLLLSDEYARLRRDPTLIRQELLANPPSLPVIIDEIQKLPQLLDEVQWLMVNQGFSFVLCGSSARKLKKSGTNLLGGRALKYELFPLVYSEIPDFDLLRALNHGLLPRHYLHSNPGRLIEAYIGTYLKEEIVAEALVRNLPAFSRFLEMAAFSNGSTPVFQNIASDCGISPPTVKEYFQILNDTLIGRWCPAFQKKPKRRVYQSPKFYYFDLALPNHLLKRGRVEYGSENFGRVFEHFIFQELLAYSHYSGKDFPVYYWRTTSQLEVDFILGDHEVCLEVKGVRETQPKHLRGINAFGTEYTAKKNLVVSLDPKPKKIQTTLVLPWQEFLAALWADDVI